MQSEDVAGPPPIPLRNISTANSSEAATPAEGTPVRKLLREKCAQLVKNCGRQCRERNDLKKIVAFQRQ